MKIRPHLAFGLFIIFASCQSLEPMESAKYAIIVEKNLELQSRKSPALAAVLNILPGGGDIYNGEWSGFVLDFLLWPISPIWAIPQGAITAHNINKAYTIAFYTAGTDWDTNRKPGKTPVAPGAVSHE